MFPDPINPSINPLPNEILSLNINPFFYMDVIKMVRLFNTMYSQPKRVVEYFFKGLRRKIKIETTFIYFIPSKVEQFNFI